MAKRQPATIGTRVEQMRLAKGLSMNELARRADVSSGYLSLFERDPFAQPSAFIVRRIAKALDVTIDDLLDGVPGPSRS